MRVYGKLHSFLQIKPERLLLRRSLNLLDHPERVGETARHLRKLHGGRRRHFANAVPADTVDDGAALSLGGPKPRLILAILLAERGRLVSLDRFVEALWGPHPPPTAVPTLQTHVSRLRRLFATVLSPDYNAAHRDHLHLDQAARGAWGWRACR